MSTTQSKSNKSHLTAISRKKPSTPVKWLYDNGYIKGDVLDFGCGRGFDADYYGFDKYDPYYFPELPRKIYDTVICCYVLNVIPTQAERDMVLGQIWWKTKFDGMNFVIVRNDIAQAGYTKRGTYQTPIDLPDFELLRKTSTYKIYIKRA